ncbi:hypothetical protein AMECASPLE_036023 [Ameca splendens]|uniref:Uncharacterized protein n=1 Tax=Ameca splendens TaxID=208324 RepID=A0ABV0YIL7_9TELE
MRSRIQVAEMSFLHRVARHSLRDRVSSSAIREELEVEQPAPPHREESVEVTRASLLDTSWMPPQGGVTGMSHQEEPQGTAQDMLEGQCLLTGLGKSASPATQFQIKRETMSTTTTSTNKFVNLRKENWSYHSDKLIKTQQQPIGKMSGPMCPSDSTVRIGWLFKLVVLK